MKRSDSEKALISLASEYKEQELADVDVKAIADKIDMSFFERKDLEQFLLGGANTIGIPVNDILSYYLKGNSTLELAQLFPNVPVGAITYLIIKNRWPELRRNFIEDIKYSTQLKAVIAKNKTINFLSDIINSFMTKHEQAVRDYVLSGGTNDKNLPKRFAINDFKKLASYMKLIQTVSEIKDSPAPPKEEVNDNRTLINIQTDNVQLDSKKDLAEASLEAEALLKRLYSVKKGEKE